MDLKSMTCPKCGAQLNFTNDQDYCFCSHCGTQVYKTDPNNKSFTYKEIDEARIKEAEVKQIVDVEKLRLEDRKQEREHKMMIIMLIAAFLMMFIPLIISFTF